MWLTQTYICISSVFIYFLHASLSLLVEKPVVEVEHRNPCVPSPCGPNSQCRVVGTTPACSCLPNYLGRSPNCRPECVINAECPGNLACQNERCADPCPGSCGIHATCMVVKHTPVCSCIPGYTGDPFAGCSLCKNLYYSSPSSREIAYILDRSPLLDIYVNIGLSEFLHLWIS